MRRRERAFLAPGRPECAAEAAGDLKLKQGKEAKTNTKYNIETRELYYVVRLDKFETMAVWPVNSRLEPTAMISALRPNPVPNLLRDSASPPPAPARPCTGVDLLQALGFGQTIEVEVQIKIEAEL